ncbi:MAG: SDR family oxidoreductase [Cytophagaceae bacterium]|jgi:3-oxoacyl-[acyl-carrier protein] reductase|nr:SDR family oxidoreductase [Cytophagaceae bacterium]
MKKNEFRIVLISGGIDPIAIATMEKFVAAGFLVVFLDSDDRKGRLVVSEMKAQKKPVDFFQVDTTQPEQLELVARQIFDKYKRIDVLINNSSSTHTLDSEDWQAVLDRSLKSVMNCIKYMAPYMVLNNFGRILNTTSLLGLYGEINQTNYNAVKNGVLGISKIWLMELSKNNITVNTVAPGYIESDYIGKNPPVMLKSITEKIPVRKIGKPIDVANAYFFLASEEASYINGTVLQVDGGYAV